MNNNKKQLKEDTSFTLSKGSSPYKIYRAPDPVMNADIQMKNNWEVQRMIEDETRMVKR